MFANFIIDLSIVNVYEHHFVTKTKDRLCATVFFHYIMRAFPPISISNPVNRSMSFI